MEITVLIPNCRPCCFSLKDTMLASLCLLFPVRVHMLNIEIILLAVIRCRLDILPSVGDNYKPLTIN